MSGIEHSDTKSGGRKLEDVPLFPLGNLVLPGGILQLRIFEPRYIDMVRWCLREDEPFVLCLSEQGGDTMAARPRNAGCSVTIIDFDTLDDGQLGITVRGGDRLRIQSAQQADDGLWLGQLALLGDEARTSTPDHYEHLGAMAERFLAELGDPYSALPAQPGDASWVGFRLTELLPLHPDVKHDLLLSLDATERLARLNFLLAQMVNSAKSSR